MERTLILFKPDAVQRGAVGEILGRFERKGLQIVGMKFMMLPKDLAEKHYAIHKGKGFYDGLIKFMTSSPIIAMVLQGPNVIEVCRKMMGATAGFKAEAGTIRGDYGISGGFNLLHGSDGPETAKAEIALWFKAEELVDWTPALRSWITE